MVELDTRTWNEFIVSELFDIHPTKSYKMVSAQLFDNAGDNPVIVNSSYNNGVGGYTSLDTTEKGNMITFSDTTTSQTIFFQENNFVGYSHIQGLYPIGQYKDMWNKKRLMFFMTIFKRTASIYGFDYNYKFHRDIASSMKVPLPVDDSGGLNWKFMEDYISDCYQLSNYNLTVFRNMIHNDKDKSIDLSSWEKFHIYDLFKIDTGTKLDRVNMTEIEPTINFVGRANSNNGVSAVVDKIEHLSPYEEGNLTLALGGEYLGSCFVQPKPFYTSQNVIVLSPIEEMSLLTKQFIATCIFKESQLYYKAFEDELNRHVNTDFTFYLPATHDGKIDVDFIDKFMKRIDNQVQSKISIFTRN